MSTQPNAQELSCADFHLVSRDKAPTDHSLECTPRFSSQYLVTQLNLLPVCTLKSKLAVPLARILDTFRRVARKHGFEPASETQSSVRVISRPQLSLRRLIRRCLFKDESSPTSASLTAHVNQSTCERELVLRGLEGNPNTIALLSEEFRSALQDLSMSQVEVYQHFEDEDQLVITCKNEFNSYYQFSKVLSSEAYSLGKSVSGFVRSFNEQYRNPRQSGQMLPQPLESVKHKVEEIVEALFSDYNYGRASTERIMVHCRTAVEKYLFAKTSHTLMEAYRTRYKLKDDLVLAIREAMQGSNLCESLGLSREHCADCQQAVECLNRVEVCCSPGEKLNCWISALTEAKSDVLDKSSGRIELEQDLEASVLAVLILNSQLRSPVSELKMLRDWGVGESLKAFEKGILLIKGLKR